MFRGEVDSEIYQNDFPLPLRERVAPERGSGEGMAAANPSSVIRWMTPSPARGEGFR
jgi:hypothetical protein